ncbi:type II toxin-antitoxin system HipA family toxin [Parachryseolinea silvisoli]|uniref:type II toxin-antitoxin system HipA family toxin n=1 Tax=Parachryseolinea silvisoli TaxID=2873601 RepID=UPI002265D08B|nr:type II toxin-antitoxin system HipA family toxin [Parachryseolinea silvisoli]MCD9014234.1 type II toxin-antitoxin system HipA family toxin [Parachryseolinea silvisoli]
MTGTLNVYLYTILIGHLTQDEHGQTLFEYTREWLANANAIPLSLSLPLQEGKFGEKQCKPFFAGVLPDIAKRKLIAQNLGISTNNDFAMLAQIGGECAGAVTFTMKDAALASAEDYKPLSTAALEKILMDLPRRPLMAGENGVRLSLAGAQDKIAIYKMDDDFFLPLENAPSSHIIKPDIEQYKGIAFNEAFCMTLAARIGLPVANVEVKKAGEIDYLLIERYDRTKEIDVLSQLRRIHQEDFCQAMGIVAERKYQIEGGPSIKDCFELVRKVSSIPVLDLNHLLDAIIFNFLIGNHDAHGKNFSLLYRMPNAATPSPGKVRLAPLYDLICTYVYPDLSKRMAMNIGKAHELDEVDPRQFERLADDIQFTKSLVKKKVTDQAKKVLEHLDLIELHHPIISEVRQFISNHCDNVLRRFSA